MIAVCRADLLILTFNYFLIKIPVRMWHKFAKFILIFPVFAVLIFFFLPHVPSYAEHKIESEILLKDPALIDIEVWTHCA